VPAFNATEGGCYLWHGGFAPQLANAPTYLGPACVCPPPPPMMPTSGYVQLRGASCVVEPGVNQNGHVLAWQLNQRYHLMGATADGSPYYRGSASPALFLVFDAYWPACARYEGFGPGWYVVGGEPSTWRLFNVMADQLETCEYRAFFPDYEYDFSKATVWSGLGEASPSPQPDALEASPSPSPEGSAEGDTAGRRLDSADASQPRPSPSPGASDPDDKQQSYYPRSFSPSATASVYAQSVWCGSRAMSGPQTLRLTEAPSPPGPPLPPSPPPPSLPPSPPERFKATTRVQIAASATGGLTSTEFRAQLISAVNSTEDEADVVIEQVATLSVTLDAEVSESNYLAAVHSSVCGSSTGCEVRVVGAARRQLGITSARPALGRYEMGNGDDIGDTSNEQEGREYDGQSEIGAGEILIGEKAEAALISGGDSVDWHETEPEPMPNGEQGTVPGRTMDRAAAKTGSWLGRTFTRVFGRRSDAASDDFANVGGTAGARDGEMITLESNQWQGTAFTRGHHRRLSEGYAVTFEVVYMVSNDTALDSNVPSDLSNTLTSALTSATGASVTGTTSIVTATTATVTFTQTGSTEDANAAVGSTLSTEALTNALASSLGVSASDLTVAAVTISFPPRAPPSPPPPSPSPPPPLPPPSTDMRITSCDECKCHLVPGGANWYDESLCLGGCTWQTDMVRRACPHLII